MKLNHYIWYSLALYNIVSWLKHASKVSTVLTQLNCLPKALVPGRIYIIRKGHCASCLVNKITSG